MGKTLNELLGKKLVFLDGGTGTVLQKKGIKPGELPENWNLDHAEDVIDVHYQYYMAGSNLVCSNTFGAFITKFPLNLERIITAAINNINTSRERAYADLKKANPDVEPELFVAFDISTTGKLLKPMGDLDFEDCITIYKKTFRIAFAQKVDCVLIETMNDGYETKAAVIAAKEIMEELKVELPILISNVYDADCRTLSGSTPETMVAMMEGLGVSAIGTNCSLGPKQMENTINRLLACSHIPVIVKPNAGLPRVVDGKTVFDVGPEEFVETMQEIVKQGAALVGGCCGTNPEYIRQLKEANKEQKLYAIASGDRVNGNSASGDRANWQDCHGIISSNTRIVHFGRNYRPVLIGERINPTGKKKFKEALRNNDISYIIHQGIEQEQAGAMALDVNVGLPEIDEKEMMLSVMTELQAVTDLPLQIDTTNAEVMEAALRRYNGKPMINSVNGKKEIMEQIFPLVKKYGGLVVALTLDEDGIPENSEKRIEIAKKIYAEAEKYGISKSDIIIDPLAMAVSSDSKAGLATLETVKAIADMGGLTSLGISNVSFGLPNREFVTSAFFNMAMTNGLSAAIMNPLQQEMIKTYKCFVLLKGMDENCTEYIDWASNIQAVSLASGGSLPLGSAPAGSSPTPSSGDSPRNAPANGKSADFCTPESPLSAAIAKGLKEDSANETKKLLETTDSLEIINNHLIPGLDYVGKRFEQKTMYLPQLLMAAEAAKCAFGEIRAYMEKSGKKGNPKGKIIIATVKGDIHDIGKNIVKVLLENYDFDVIDLGKDVPPETIVEACKKDHIELVGLSALMTTTVPAMEETIKQLRKECPWAKVCVGGAVLTQEYANMIGADFYGKDAMDTVRYANEVF